ASTRTPTSPTQSPASSPVIRKTRSTTSCHGPMPPRHSRPWPENSGYVGAHGGRRGAVGKQVELAFPDAVLHLAACAVEVLVEAAGRPGLDGERGDDEARVGLALCPLSLGHDPPPTAPALAGGPHEVPEPAAGRPVSPLSTAASSSASAMLRTSRTLRARPNRKSTELASHQAISSSRAKPESARSTMRTFGQRWRKWRTMRSISCTEPAAASMLAGRSLAQST